MTFIDKAIPIVLLGIGLLWLIKMFKPMLSGIWNPIGNLLDRVRGYNENPKNKTVSVQYE